MKKFLNIYLLFLAKKMKTPYRKLTMKRGANAIEIFEIISIAVKILRQKVSKIKVHMSCRIKSNNKYFSQKVNTIRDKTDFLALQSYF